MSVPTPITPSTVPSRLRTGEYQLSNTTACLNLCTPRRRVPLRAAHGPGAPDHGGGTHAAVSRRRRGDPAAPKRYRKHRKNGHNLASVHSLIVVMLCKHDTYTSTRPRKPSQLMLPYVVTFLTQPPFSAPG